MTSSYLGKNQLLGRIKSRVSNSITASSSIIIDGTHSVPCWKGKCCPSHNVPHLAIFFINFDVIIQKSFPQLPSFNSSQFCRSKVWARHGKILWLGSYKTQVKIPAGLHSYLELRILFQIQMVMAHGKGQPTCQRY